MSPRPAAPFVAAAAICFSLQAISQQPPVQADRKFGEFPLPNPGSGPTTVTIAPDGTLWFTEGTGNRIGWMAPDGTA